MPPSARGNSRSATASSLPDIPRYVEARGLCRRGGTRELKGLIYDPLTLLAVVFGVPTSAALQEATANCRTLVSMPERPLSLPGWRAETARIYVLRYRAGLPKPGKNIRWLAPGEVAAVPDLELREELNRALRFTRVAVATSEGCPVAFCYAGAETDALWDISIDTLAPYRRQGRAAACVSWMIRRTAKLPVWGAVESNAASRRLAEKLGFEPVDEVVVWERPR